MKKFKNYILGILVAFSFTMGVNAASGSVTVTTSSKTPVVGSTFTVNVKVSCSEAIGTWKFGISYDSGTVSLVSGDTTVAGYGDGNMKSKTYTYKFKAIKSGSAKIQVANAQMVSWTDDANLFTPSTNSVSLTVKTQAEIEASYSKDNYLKSLSVEGYELSPAFDKDTTSYTVSVPDTVNEIKVSAAPNDSRSKVSGTGSIDLSEGTNKVEVVVTAQNGGIRTYTITVDVKDLNPIKVVANGKDYTVVKKQELLVAPTGFTLSSIKIDDIEVPAYTSELVSMYVVGLKDENANISMFAYDPETKTYSPYNELKGHSVVLYPKAIEDVPKNFTKTTRKFGDIEYEILKSDKVEGLYLVYGLNVETGETGYYIYDEKTDSFVTYDAETSINNEDGEYKIYLIVLGLISGTFLLITILVGIKNAKLKKMIRVKLRELREENDTLKQDSSKKNKKEKGKKDDKDISD